MASQLLTINVYSMQFDPNVHTVAHKSYTCPCRVISS